MTGLCVCWELAHRRVGLSRTFAQMSTPLPHIAPATDERDTLLAFLGYQRAVVRRKVEGLSQQQWQRRLDGHPSTLSIGAIVKHLSSCEIWWARAVWAGNSSEQIQDPWGAGWQQVDHDWEWETHTDSPATLLNWFDQAITLADETYAPAALHELSRRPWGSPTPEYVNLRWILVHLIEEYARHLGHLDLLREQIDGSVGD